MYMTMTTTDISTSPSKESIADLRSKMLSFLQDTLNGEVPLVPLHGMNINTKTCTCKLKEACRSPGKHPWLRTNWRKINPSLVKKHIEQDKIYDIQTNGNVLNFGALCGLPSKKNAGKYLVVVDVDHEDPWSLDIIKELVAGNNVSFCYRTGSGGLHLWYYSKEQIRNSVKTVHPNIDIRGIGGYVVIPGSLHVGSGGKLYDFDKENMFAQPILDLPESFYKTLKKTNTLLVEKNKKTIASTKASINKIKTTATTSTITYRMPIAILRNQIETNPSFKIANGTRNDSLYRLLSQDRRNGNAKTVKDLFVKAKKYKAFCEERDTVTDRELYAVCHSAFKSNKPKINKSMTHRDLAGNYFEWVKTNRTLQYTDEAKTKMIKADEEFFKALTVTGENDSPSYLPLQYIHNARDKYMIESHGLTTFFKYPLRYLAEKLKEYGFKMKRTAKGNIWLVYVPTFKTFAERQKEKMDNEVYIKSNIRYPNLILNDAMYRCTNNKAYSLAMTTTNTTTNAINAPLQEVSADAEDQSTTAVATSPEEETSGMPQWADKNVRPIFMTGIKMPDLIADPNAIPWYTPPGYKDEQITKDGKFTRHDNEEKYCQFGMGRRKYVELTEQFHEFLEAMSPEEQEAFGDLNFIRDEARTAEVFDSIEEGFVIGTMSQLDPAATFALEVLKRFPEKDMLACRLWNGEIAERKYFTYKRTITDDPSINTDLMYIAFQDVSYALAMNNFEILYYKKPLPLEPKDKNIFAPYGYDDKVREYNMVVRYRIAQGYPGYVSDDKLEEEDELAHSKYLEDNHSKFEAKAEEEAKLREEAALERKSKLEKIKEELAGYNKTV